VLPFQANDSFADVGIWFVLHLGNLGADECGFASGHQEQDSKSFFGVLVGSFKVNNHGIIFGNEC